MGGNVASTQADGEEVTGDGRDPGGNAYQASDSDFGRATGGDEPGSGQHTEDQWGLWG